MKEQNKILTIKNKLLFCAIAVIVALAGFCVRVSAAESYNYSFSFTYNFDSFYRSYNANLNLSYPIAGYIDSGNVMNFLRLSDSELVTYNFPVDMRQYDLDDNLMNESNSVILTFSLNERSEYSTNIPLFSNREEVLNYLLTGDDTGQLNKQIEERENFSLTGFSCDNTIYATWTGVSGCPVVDKTNVEVLIRPSYLYIVNSGDELQSWDEPDSIIVDYNDFSFSKPYEEFMEGCPYEGSCFLTLYFTPQVMIEGTLYKGSSVSVSFDENGNTSGTYIPSSGLPLVYSDFYLKDFTYLEDSSGLNSVNGSIGRSIKFLWNGASFGDSIQYITSNVKIEIYTMSTVNYDNWSWYTYEPSYHVGIDRDYVQFDLLELDKELREHRCTILNKDTVSHAGVYFRFTPYYTTSESNCYGRSVYVQLSKNGSVISCSQSMGDAFSEDNPGYESVVENMEDKSMMGDLLDNIFTPSEDDFSVDDLTLNFFSLLQGLISSLGQFPSLFAAVFSFLPDYYISMLVVGLSVIILLRILGR